MVDQGKLMARMGSLSLLGRLTDKLHQKIPEHLQALRAALDAADPEALASEAHRLKGAISNFEAEELTQLSKQLEQLARKPDLASAGSLVARLPRLLDELLEELRAIASP